MVEKKTEYKTCSSSQYPSFQLILLSNPLHSHTVGKERERERQRERKRETERERQRKKQDQQQRKKQKNLLHQFHTQPIESQAKSWLTVLDTTQSNTNTAKSKQPVISIKSSLPLRGILVCDCPGVPCRDVCLGGQSMMISLLASEKPAVTVRYSLATRHSHNSHMCIWDFP